MTEYEGSPASKQNPWMRGLYMLLMVFAFHVSWTVMFVIAVCQFILAAASDRPNDRLAAFGRSLGSYVGEVVCFLTFASEEIPFPFRDWPSGEGGGPG